MRVPDPKANTTTEAYLAYKAGYLQENELKPVLYEPYLHFDAWLAYWAGLTDNYPLKGLGKNLFNFGQFYDNRASFTVNDGSINVTESSIEFTGHTATSSQFYPAHEASNKSIYGMTNLKPDTTYTISYKADTDTQCWVFFFNASNQRTSVQRVYTTTNVAMTFTTPEDLSWYSVRIDNRAAASNSITDIQIEQGSSASSYEPYTGEPEMLTDEEALVAYLSGVTDTYPEEIKDPYDVRIVGYLKHLASIRWPEPDYPVNNEEFYLSTMEPTHTSNSEPSSDIELDTAEGKIVSVEAYGDTYQQTYSGKNLFNFENNTLAWLGRDSITHTNDSNSVTMVASGTAGAQAARIDFGGFTSGKTYSLSCKAKKLVAGSTGAPVLRVSYMYSDDGETWTWGGDAWVQNAPVVNTEYNVTATFTGHSYYRLYFYNNANTPVTVGESSTYYNIQLEEGSPTSYEPYVGGIPAPNPDYPQAVQVVTGEQTVEVTGKNRINGSYSEISQTARCTAEASGNGFKITSTSSSGATYATVPIPNIAALLGQTVTVSYVATGDGIRARFFYLNTTGGATGSVGSSETVTLPDSLGSNSGIGVVFYTSNNSSATYNDIQLEIGSTATAYEPYQAQSYTIDLGSTELCKIGDYQDYIYKSGDDWYLHKACGKFTFYGSAISWSSGGEAGTGYYAWWKKTASIGLAQPQVNENDTPAFLTTFGQMSYGTGKQQVGFMTKTSTDAPNIIFITDSSITTPAALNTALNGSAYYYVLATATDTKITDATLVGQLEALAGADTYNEKTYIKVTATDPNLPALLEVEAYKY